MVVTREKLKLRKKKGQNLKEKTINDVDVDVDVDVEIIDRRPTRQSKRKREIVGGGGEEEDEKNEVDNSIKRSNKRKISRGVEKKENGRNIKKARNSKKSNSTNSKKGKRGKKEKEIETVIIISESDNNSSDNESDSISDSEDDFIDVESVSETETEDEIDKKYNLRRRKPILSNERNSSKKDNYLMKTEVNKEAIAKEEHKEEEEEEIKKENKKVNEKLKQTNTKNNSKSSKRRKVSKPENKKIDEEIITLPKNDAVNNHNTNDISKANKDNSNDNSQYELSLSENLTVEDNLSDESENDEEWEEIDISSEKSDLSSSDKLLKDKKSITISLDKKKEDKKEKKRGINKQDRDFRKGIHKAELICFLISCQLWNSWCNSDLIKGIALSLLPEHLFFEEKRIGSGNIKLLAGLIEELCEWYIQFLGKENMKHIKRNRKKTTTTTTAGKKENNTTSKSKGNKNAKSNNNQDQNTMTEKITDTKDTKKLEVKSINILRLFLRTPQWIKEFENSETIYLYLFVLFARLIGFKCRFVASLYPIPLSFSKKKIITNEALILWCEIYCAKEKKWIVVNPLESPYLYTKRIDYKINCQKPANYIMTINQDGYIKDMTKYYDKKFYLSTWKLRLEDEDLNKIIGEILNRDHEDDHLKEIIPEDEDPDKTMVFPTSIGAFVNHPLYALERHVKQYEVLYSKEPILGYIRKEPIYPRRNVRPVSTEGHWIREGLQLKKGEKPLKYAKSKAYMLRQFRLEYLIKKHAALPKDFELGEEMVPLYGKWQTEKYKPKPVVNVNYDYDDYDYNFFFLYI